MVGGCFGKAAECSHVLRRSRSTAPVIRMSVVENPQHAHTASVQRAKQRVVSKEAISPPLSTFAHTYPSAQTRSRPLGPSRVRGRPGVGECSLPDGKPGPRTRVAVVRPEPRPRHKRSQTTPVVGHRRNSRTLCCHSGWRLDHDATSTKSSFGSASGVTCCVSGGLLRQWNNDIPPISRFGVFDGGRRIGNRSVCRWCPLPREKPRLCRETNHREIAGLASSQVATADARVQRHKRRTWYRGRM